MPTSAAAAEAGASLQAGAAGLLPDVALRVASAAVSQESGSLGPVNACSCAGTYATSRLGRRGSSGSRLCLTLLAIALHFAGAHKEPDGGTAGKNCFSFLRSYPYALSIFQNACLTSMLIIWFEYSQL